jgi:inorganic phosphate transporter, PiT family
MGSAATATATLPSHAGSPRPNLEGKTSAVTIVAFVGMLAIGLFYTAYSLLADVSEAGAKTTTLLPYLLLGVALLIALGFEFVNGFHDTANAVATVIYTHSLTPNFAVGLGTMVGWKRIVVTVGEKIGKSHLTYGQVASPSWWPC